MLCQIVKCCRYAEKTGRYVVVDTNYKSTISFHDDLDKYFSSRHEGLILGLEKIKKSYWGGKRNYSGFSKLAMMLNTSRPILMHLIEAQSEKVILPL